VSAATWLFEKILIEHIDGGYLIDLGVEIAENAQILLKIFKDYNKKLLFSFKIWLKNSHKSSVEYFGSLFCKVRKNTISSSSFEA
jgi:hypothetical protein